MTSKSFAVIGSPIAHSLSPAIHAAAYKYLGLDWTYSKYEVQPGNLSGFIAENRGSLSGLSVTMPLKVEAAQLADQADQIVRELAIANTLLLAETGISAFNTDVFGISQSLAECFSSKVESVALIGAGATARSALMALSLKAPGASVSVYVRHSTSTEALSSLAESLGVTCHFLPLEDLASDHDLSISTIPSNALPTSFDHRDGWLLDVNYANPDENFLSTFDAAKVVSGKAMLLWQAVAQIRLFTSANANQELPDEAGVFQAMTAALQ